MAKDKFEIDDAGISTCDRERPHFEIRAKHATVHTGNKIVARNIGLYVLGKKYFWWPYAAIPLQNMGESPIQIQPGYSSKEGTYLLTSKAFSLAKWLWGRWHLDYRFRKGFAAGLDFGYHFDGKKTDGVIQTYLSQDRDAPDPHVDDPYSESQRRLRGRVTWKHRTDFTPDTHLILRYNRLADEFFLQDFFEREFRSEVEPESFMTLTHNTDRSGSYLFFKKQMNYFEDTTERLPEIRFDWKNAPFLSSKKIYYENSNSLANLNEKVGRSSEDFQVFRADSFHEWSRPMKWNEFKLTPSLNFRETLYSRKADREVARARTAFGGAMDLRTQFYRTYDKTSDFLGIEVNQLRHVFEPSIRYDGTVQSSLSNEVLHKFDAVDSIDDGNKITFGMENRIQTKRVVNGKMQRVDLVSLNTFVAYDFHPDLEYSRSGFSTFDAELQLRPYEWLQFEIRSSYDMTRDRFLDFNQDLLIRKGRWRVLLGHRWVPSRKFLNAEGNNQFVFDLSYWLNERWQVGGHVRFNAEKSDLEEWQLSATRDLHDFLLDLGYNVRSSDIDESNKELFFLFRLKAFPGASLKSGNRASFSEPRIGNTVAGSNTANLDNTLGPGV